MSVHQRIPPNTELLCREREKNKNDLTRKVVKNNVQANLISSSTDSSRSIVSAPPAALHSIRDHLRNVIEMMGEATENQGSRTIREDDTSEMFSNVFEETSTILSSTISSMVEVTVGANDVKIPAGMSQVDNTAESNQENNEEKDGDCHIRETYEGSSLLNENVGNTNIQEREVETKERHKPNSKCTPTGIKHFCRGCHFQNFSLPEEIVNHEKDPTCICDCIHTTEKSICEMDKRIDVRCACHKEMRICACHKTLSPNIIYQHIDEDPVRRDTMTAAVVCKCHPPEIFHSVYCCPFHRNYVNNVHSHYTEERQEKEHLPRVHSSHPPREFPVPDKKSQSRPISAKSRHLCHLLKGKSRKKKVIQKKSQQDNSSRMTPVCNTVDGIPQLQKRTHQCHTTHQGILKETSVKHAIADTPEKVDVYYFDHGNSGYYRTTDRLPVKVIDMYVESSDEYANEFWADIFGMLHIGVAFVTHFVLQLFRFLLYSIIRPLLIGGIQLLSDYFFKPMLSISFNGVIQPILIFLYNIATSIRDLCAPIAHAIGYFLREVAVVFRAARLVEVHHINQEKCI